MRKWNPWSQLRWHPAVDAWAWGSLKLEPILKHVQKCFKCQKLLTQTLGLQQRLLMCPELSFGLKLRWPHCLGLGVLTVYIPKIFKACKIVRSTAYADCSCASREVRAQYKPFICSTSSRIGFTSEALADSLLRSTMRVTVVNEGEKHLKVV